MARTFQLMKKVPTLGRLGDDEESWLNSLTDWFESDTGQNVLANVTNIVSSKAGVEPVYRTPTGVYRPATTSIDPMLLLVGGALAVVLLTRK